MKQDPPIYQPPQKKQLRWEVCGSGLKALNLAVQAIVAGSNCEGVGLLKKSCDVGPGSPKTIK